MRYLRLLCAVASMALWAPRTQACTNLIIGKNASTDGSVMITYADDSYGKYGILEHYGAGIHPKGEMLQIYQWSGEHIYLGEIPQAEQTYNVIGNMNEFQVAIGETTFGGREELQNKQGHLDYGSLIYIALQRSKTAREAIKVMTELVQEHGYYSTGESFSIADANEAWIMEMIGKGEGNKGAVWVAVRIPDDCIAAHANQSRIHQFPLNDSENCLYSPDVISFAREKGYYKGADQDFSFSATYNPMDFGGLRACESRVWSFYNRFTDRGEEFLPYVLGKTKTPMPLYLKPNRKLSLEDVRDMMRDHYEGTPLDLTQDVGAGLYHSPYRLSPLTFTVDGTTYFNERPISTQQTAWVYVAQLRNYLPDAIGGVLWFGMDDANTTVFSPVYGCTDQVPECYTEVSGGADRQSFSFDSSFWVFNWVANMIYPWYDLKIGDLRATQSQLEKGFIDAQPGIEQVAKQMMDKDPAEARRFLTQYSIQSAEHVLNTWRKLGEYLVVKYSDGAIRQMKDTESVGSHANEPTDRFLARPGFPEEFKRQYVEQTGDRYKVYAVPE